MSDRKLLSTIVVTLMIVLMAAPTFAQTSDTLSKVLKRGVLRVGVLTTSPPWGMLNEKYEVVGFDIDIAKEMAKELGVKLELVETLNINRVPYLTTDRVDIMIAVFGNTLERAQSVAFSQPYAPYMLVICGPKKVKVDSLEDLSGKTVALGRGTTADLILSEKAPKDTQILRYESPPDAFLAVEQGKADVVSEGYPHVMLEIQNHPDWELKLKGEPYSQTYPCMAVKLGDQIWLNWVNLFILHKLNDGFIQDLYGKWFDVPWPKAGIWPNF